MDFALRHPNPMLRFSAAFAGALACLSSLVPASAPAEEELKISPKFWTFYDAYCAECHDPDTAKGDFSDDLLKISQSPEDAEYWQLLLDNLHLGEMPPEDAKKQPTIEELEPIIEWVEAELARAATAMKGSTGEVVLRRLNRTEYENTIADLFDVRGSFAEGFPADAEEDGFNNIGSALMLSAEQVDQYMRATDFILDRAIVTNERPETMEEITTLALYNERYEESWRQRQERLKTDPPTKTELARIEDSKRNGTYGHHYYPEHGEDFLLPMQYMKPGTNDWFRVREPGWYRFAFTGYAARNPDGLPLRLRVEYGSFRQGTIPEVAGLVQFATTEPVEHEFRVYLQANQRIQLQCLDAPNWLAGPKIAENHDPLIAIRSMEMEGPLNEVWPPRGHQLLLGSRDANKLTDEEAAAALTECAPRLFRRPVEHSVIAEFVDFYHAARTDLKELDAFKMTVKAMMASPHFLYHVEPGDAPDGYALANRLSYFLWRSAPDAELLELAAQGSLAQPDMLKKQVDRLLANDKSERFLEDFTGQWLGIDLVGDMQPDENLYPEYDPELERAMVQETQAFVREILHQDLSLTNLIDSDWAMLNDRMADHYGIEGVEGNVFRRISLDATDRVRGGLITQASILNITSNGTVTSPVVRGTWILENLLGSPAPPPPPDVPAIEPDIRGATTIQEQLAKHRDIAQCGACHRKIDPYGMALENFDVIGAWRENYRALDPNSNPNRPKLIEGKPVDAGDTLPKLGDFADFREFRDLLTQREDLIYDVVAHKLAVFALGRHMDFADEAHLRDIAEATRQNGGGMKTLMHQLVANELFQNP